VRTKPSCLRLGSMSLLCVAVLSFGRVSLADSETPGTSEPLPPDILELIQLPGPVTPGSVALEAVVKPVVDGEVDLEVLSPAGLRFTSRARSRRLVLRRGGPVHREPLLVDVPAGQATVVRVRATLMAADGKPSLILDRELRFNSPAPDLARQRIPIVRVAPDGSRSVEYMERGEAQRRGLLRNEPATQGAPAPSPRVPSAQQPGGDSPEAPAVYE
jgi:hypothetical protein